MNRAVIIRPTDTLYR